MLTCIDLDEDNLLEKLKVSLSMRLHGTHQVAVKSSTTSLFSRFARANAFVSRESSVAES